MLQIELTYMKHFRYIKYLTLDFNPGLDWCYKLTQTLDLLQIHSDPELDLCYEFNLTLILTGVTN